MTQPGLTLATYPYEHTDALFDGSVKVAGFATDVHTEPVVSGSSAG